MLWRAIAVLLFEGADDRDWQVPPALQEIVSPRSLSECRIAWTDQFGTVPVAETRSALGSSASLSLIQQLVTNLQEAGCYLEYYHPPNFNFEQAVETSGIEQLGYQIMSPLIPFTNSSALLRGFTKNTGFSFKKYAQALERRDRFIAQMQSFLIQWDAWICPVTPGVAFSLIVMLAMVLVLRYR